MTGFSQSALLQALGWATLNSFWQAGALWCAYLLVRRFAMLSPEQHYRFAATSLVLSAGGFFSSIFFYLQGSVQVAGPFALLIKSESHWFSTILTAASFSYLFLLGVPAARLFQNWRFLIRLRHSQLAKAPVQYRLYVQSIAARLCIRKKVQVHLSALVQSPVTIGFFKPLILLPVAGFNQLTTQQAEAILLHELAHIRRYDYLANILICLIQTALYFNPFVRFFVRAAENSRESCCDGLVLQFGYDPFSYASALLHLQKQATPLPRLALAASGKNQLFNRIEAIVGMPGKMPVLKMHHFTGLLASVLFVLALHSLLVAGKKTDPSDAAHVLTNLGNPFYLGYQEAFKEGRAPFSAAKKGAPSKISLPSAAPAINYNVLPEPPDPPMAPEDNPAFVAVAQVVEPIAELSAEEQQQITKTVATTKEVLATLQWKELEKTIADGLTEAEKQHTFEQYQKEVAQLDWERMEKNLAVRYDQTNWEKINRYLTSATLQLKLDSTEATILKSISELDRVAGLKCTVPFPDLPIDTLNAYKQQLHSALDSIKILRQKPVIRL